MRRLGHIRIQCFVVSFPLLWLTWAPKATAIDFDHEVVPILREHCSQCHGGDEAKGGFSINTRELFLDADVATPGSPDQSHFLELIASADADEQMPPKDLPRVPDKAQKILRDWVEQQMPWTTGFTFATRSYQPPLLPRQVALPGPPDANPIDQILNQYLTDRGLPQPEPVGDQAFLRRATLDLIGLLPSQERRSKFLADDSSNKRASLVEELLQDEIAYTEHWLTFWNDWLRNDYAGTGFITGGRKQISNWLYRSLIDNKPFDQFTRELIAPQTSGSRGFIDGIKWRGEVSAGQTVEIQFAQSVAQSFLGINLKCASCHDSFIDQWKLSDAYSLAAVYSQKPLEVHRCDKPTGETAEAGWLFPELGEIDKELPREKRLERLANLITSPQNGRYQRTVVNRLWAQLMGRGIVHPLDAMHTEPWNEDLLDFLANYLVKSNYDLKAVIRLIATSRAYATKSEVLHGDPESHTAPDGKYVYAGPRARRMTAEQFLDCVWQMTGAAPGSFDAPVLRGKIGETDTSSAVELKGEWIWGVLPEGTNQSPAGEQLVFRKTIKLSSPVSQGVAVMSCDNGFDLYIGRRLIASSDNWEKVQTISMSGRLKKGDNEIMIVARNAGKTPNPAGLYFESRLSLQDETAFEFFTDGSWSYSEDKITGGREGRLGRIKGPWKEVQSRGRDGVYPPIQVGARRGLAAGTTGSDLMVRASLLKSDFFMRSLGRPNRDQIVTSRPSELNTLEAIDLANGGALSKSLSSGAIRFSETSRSSADLIRAVYLTALSREPTSEESAILLDAIGEQPEVDAIEDLLWVICVMPEFLMVR